MEYCHVVATANTAHALLYNAHTDTPALDIANIHVVDITSRALYEMPLFCLSGDFLEGY